MSLRQYTDPYGSTRGGFLYGSTRILTAAHGSLRKYTSTRILTAAHAF